jgi:hypothetical protein
MSQVGKLSSVPLPHFAAVPKDFNGRVMKG